MNKETKTKFKQELLRLYAEREVAKTQDDRLVLAQCVSAFAKEVYLEFARNNVDRKDMIIRGKYGESFKIMAIGSGNEAVCVLSGFLTAKKD